MQTTNFESFPEVLAQVQGIVVKGYLLCVTDTTSVVIFDGAEFPVTYDNESLREVDIDDCGDKVITRGGSVLCTINHTEQEMH